MTTPLHRNGCECSQATPSFVLIMRTIGADVYYSSIASPLELGKAALYITQPILADGVVIWRCYVLNNRSLLVGIPGCIMLLTNAAMGYYVVRSLSQAGSGSTVYTTAAGYITIQRPCLSVLPALHSRPDPMARDNATPIVVDYSMDPTVDIVQYDMMSRKKLQSLIVLG
ncbi:hypothetical protein M405DRAFT_919678 [Rhizopogon salebrosus TDB-379]|nr:hypothetical protein M405DRAFT_919678 [Rhizopogon salebrosus TDB-379]